MLSVHVEAWWADFELGGVPFDVASVTEALTDVILPGIPSLLLRREAETAAGIVLRHLNKPASAELAERATLAVVRLAATVERINDRSIVDDAGTAAAETLLQLLQGRWAQAAAEAEALIGTPKLVRAFIEALHLDTFAADLTLQLLQAGHNPSTAVRSSAALTRYSWWPSWLRAIVTERVLMGTLDDDIITALKECAYAGLTPSQAKMAKRLINAEPQLVEATASRLEALGEHPAARKLRGGDVRTVAFAARLIPV